MKRNPTRRWTPDDDESTRSDTELETVREGTPDSGFAPVGTPASPGADPDAATVDGGPSSRSGSGPDTVRTMPYRIGPYFIKSVLGEGGMGCVYLAEQTEPVRREVAIKLIRSSFTSPSSVVRFDAERQAMARLAHPAIAQIFEAGTTDDGFPYFVMELVPGMPLTQFCDVAYLPIEERLKLFVRVCRGVEHAHRKGILHRDLKPSNILVRVEDGEAVPKIIDFGIAKAMDQPLTEAPLHTRFGIGTPEYMSPESFDVSGRGSDVDTRTDVYSLGVILYEMLVAELPFETRSSGLVEIYRTIRDTDPERPSRRFSALEKTRREFLAKRRDTDPQSLVRSLEGDLDWIVAKAMEKDRDRRYGSAAELADDVQRHLDLQPVEASPPNWRYRTGRFVQRNHVPVAAASLALLALVLGIVGTTWGMIRAGHEAERAGQEAQKAQEALLDAEQVTDFLIDLFEVSDPREAGGESITARQLLDRGAERVEDRLADQPLRQARLLHTIGTIYDRLQVHQEARRLVSEALELRRQRLSGDDADVAESQFRLAVIDRQLANYEEAEAAAREALKVRLTQYGDDDRRVGEAERELGVVLYLMGRSEEAEPRIRRALAIAERHDDPETHAASLEALGNLMKDRGRCAEAVPIFEKALQLDTERLGPKDPRLAYSLNNLGGCLGELGRYEQARGLFEQALAIQREVLGPHATAVAAGQINLGIVYRELGEFGRAEGALITARDGFEVALGSDHPLVANAMAELGVVQWQQMRFQEAEGSLRQSLAICQDKLGDEHLLTAWVQWALANVLRDAGSPAEAEELYRSSLESRRAQLPADHPDVAQVESDYAQLLRETGRDAEADALAGS